MLALIFVFALPQVARADDGTLSIEITVEQNSDQTVNITTTVTNLSDATLWGVRVEVWESYGALCAKRLARTYYGLPISPGKSFKFTRTNQSVGCSSTLTSLAWVDGDRDATEVRADWSPPAPTAIKLKENAIQNNNLVLIILVAIAALTAATAVVKQRS